jgi:hypothetical protein
VSNVSQTWAIIGALAVIFGAQTAWILYAFAQVNKRIDEVKGDLGKLDDKIDTGLARLDDKIDTGLAGVDTRLDELKTEIVRDHGERIAKLEQHVILHP